MDFGEAEFGQPACDFLARRLSRLVFVEHNDDATVAVGVFPNQTLLRWRQGTK
jgi:hypothetical protein